ncbi:hypothetical protein B0H63DRAFT_468188 [Podospora didyma]|uniref:Uncharacterized protein n=1 Tax=Podospora didyma TaxID=330526 RepID=A0AAE0U0R5_9PEZI|nr:hypothetical protein B0H63DRAFT_468188 [Podospora didyma]
MEIENPRKRCRTELALDDDLGNGQGRAHAAKRARQCAANLDTNASPREENPPWASPSPLLAPSPASSASDDSALSTPCAIDVDMDPFRAMDMDVCSGNWRSAATAPAPARPTPPSQPQSQQPQVFATMSQPRCTIISGWNQARRNEYPVQQRSYSSNMQF